jgi:hypothetical protein
MCSSAVHRCVTGQSDTDFWRNYISSKRPGPITWCHGVTCRKHVFSSQICKKSMLIWYLQGKMPFIEPITKIILARVQKCLPIERNFIKMPNSADRVVIHTELNTAPRNLTWWWQYALNGNAVQTHALNWRSIDVHCNTDNSTLTFHYRSLYHLLLLFTNTTNATCHHAYRQNSKL